MFAPRGVSNSVTSRPSCRRPSRRAVTRARCLRHSRPLPRPANPCRRRRRRRHCVDPRNGSVGTRRAAWRSVISDQPLIVLQRQCSRNVRGKPLLRLKVSISEEDLSASPAPSQRAPHRITQSSQPAWREMAIRKELTNCLTKRWKHVMQRVVSLYRASWPCAASSPRHRDQLAGRDLVFGFPPQCSKPPATAGRALARFWGA